jgi:3-phenylpropionate/cinnamic acid dioxygenase small subunit
MLSHEDERQITAVMIRYATGIDRRDWPLLATCFTTDCRSEYGNFGKFETGKALVEFMDMAHRDVGPTLHRMSNTVIQGDGDRATARTYVDALLTPREDGSVTHRGVGYYDDDLVKTADGWRISHRRFIAVQIT